MSTTQERAATSVGGNGFRGKEAGRRALSRTGGASPFLVIGVAFVLGVAAAKWLDWRGHAHPR